MFSLPLSFSAQRQHTFSSIFSFFNLKLQCSYTFSHYYLMYTTSESVRYTILSIKLYLICLMMKYRWRSQSQCRRRHRHIVHHPHSMCTLLTAFTPSQYIFWSNTQSLFSHISNGMHTRKCISCLYFVFTSQWMYAIIYVF